MAKGIRQKFNDPAKQLAALQSPWKKGLNTRVEKKPEFGRHEFKWVESGTVYTSWFQEYGMFEQEYRHMKDIRKRNDPIETWCEEWLNGFEKTL